MKKINMKKVSRNLHKVGFVAKKHLPTIMVIGGVAGVVVSEVLACKATTNLPDVLEKHKKDVELIHEAIEHPDHFETEVKIEDENAEITQIYARTGVRIVKLYFPAISVGILSLASILMSHKMLSDRNVALAAAYATVDKGFRQYRSRVKEQLGNEADYEFKHGITNKIVEDTVIDENGEEKTITKTVKSVDPTQISVYARFFEEYTQDSKGNVKKNPNWCEDNSYNLMFLKKCEEFATNKLIAKGHLFLNDVYEMLGLPTTKDGQVIGWMYDEDKNDEDNYVSFGLYNDQLSYSDFVNGNDNGILLDFNVDGNIWDKM